MGGRMIRIYAETIEEFKEKGGIVQYDGPNFYGKHLFKGYTGLLYHIFIDKKLVEVSYLTSDEFGRTITKYLFKE